MCLFLKSYHWLEAVLSTISEQINVSNYANSQYMHDRNGAEIKLLNYQNNVWVKILYRCFILIQRLSVVFIYVGYMQYNCLCVAYSLIQSIHTFLFNYTVNLFSYFSMYWRLWSYFLQRIVDIIQKTVSNVWIFRMSIVVGV